MFPTDHKIIIYTTSELAQKLDVNPAWLKRNRKYSPSPIPYCRLGRSIRYIHTHILKWLGRKDLELEFYSTKKLAQRLDMSSSWIKRNRTSNNPIPYRRIEKLIRYNITEVNLWLKKNKKTHVQH